VDLKVVLPLIAAVAGISTLGKSRRTPVWMTLLIFAFSSFLSMHGGENAGRESEQLAEELASD
jgi:hypothetical protein